MRKVKRLIAVMGLIAVVSMLWLQHEQNRQLVQELERAQQEKVRLESLQVAPNPEQSQNEAQPKQAQELESELIRLRGAATRATRAEAELAQLRLEVERLRTQANGSASSASQNGDTLWAYLGNAVETPANLDSAYTKEGLSSAVQVAAQKAGVSIKRIGIDDSEFPFLTAVVCEPGDWEKLKAQVKSMDGYEFHGAVGNDTVNTFCIVPSQAYPSGASQRASRRLTVRMQAFYDTFNSQSN